MQLDNTLLKYLIPIKQLQEAHRVEIAEQSKILELVTGEELSANELRHYFVYLIGGRVDLIGLNEMPLLVDTDETRACYPLFSEGQNKTGMVANTRCKIALFDRAFFHHLLDQELMTGDEFETSAMNEIEANLFNEIMHSFNMGELNLPCLPAIASKVKKALNHPKISTKEMALVISADPVLTIQLVHAANKLNVNIGYSNTSVLDAIDILGKQTSKELVISYVDNNAFSSKSKMLNQRMVDLYDASVDIAAISFALSKQSGILTPEHLSVAGLIYEIGVIPILNSIEKTGLIINDEDELDDIIQRLRGVVGSALIHQLEVSDKLAAVVENYENWQRQEKGEIDICDMVIIAQIYHRLKHHQIEGLPKIEKVPAFKKLYPANQSPDFAKNVLHQAHEIIALTMRLLKI